MTRRRGLIAEEVGQSPLHLPSARSTSMEWFIPAESLHRVHQD